MKKLLSLLLISALALTLAACGEQESPSEQNEQTKQTDHILQSASSDQTESTEAVEGDTVTDQNTETEDGEPTVEELFQNYPEKLYPLGLFDSVANLDSLQIFNWAKGLVEPIRKTADQEKYIFSYTYSSEALNEEAYRYLGHRFDFATVNGEGSPGVTEYSYNEADFSVTVTYYGAFGDVGPEIAYVGCEQTDETHFTVRYTSTYPGEKTLPFVIEVEFADGGYLVRAQKAISGDDPAPNTGNTDKDETSDGKPSAEEVGSKLHNVSYLSQYLILHYENGSALNAKQMLTYFINNIGADLEVSVGDKVPAETIYEYVAKSFPFDESVKALLQACETYNAEDDTFTLWGEYYSNSVHTTQVFAYDDLGNNEYVLYIQYAAWDSGAGVFSNFSNWKARVTYRENTEPKDFTLLWQSFEKVDAIPDTAIRTGINYFSE